MEERVMQTRIFGRNRFLTIIGFITFFIILTFTAAPKSRAAGLLIAEGGFGGVLEIIEHDVSVSINNGVAVTEITQVFRNTENRQVEALYTFPVPKGASVSNFSMWINGQEVIGEVLEKEKAREIYNSYKQRNRDPGLLEQTDYKTFEMRIFPIAAGAEQRVQIAYYQELDFDNDWATFVYPLATVTRPTIDSRVQGRFSASLDIKSAIPVVAMESPSHKQDFLVVKHSDNFYEASLESRDGDLARDLVLAFQVSRPQTGLDLITSKEKGEDGYFSLTLTAGEELNKNQTGSDYVFILDVSGSMQNEAKLETSTHSVDAFINALGPEDRFEIITFNRQVNTLFNGLQNADAASLERAAGFLLSQEARGGTQLKPAMTTAYKYGNPDRTLNAVILSDGMTEQAERQQLISLINSRPANVRVFCIGVGNEVNRPLLKQIAVDAGGLASFISRGDDFKRQAKAFRRKLMHPVAVDLAIALDGIEVYDLVPEKLPNLYHGVPVRLYGRYKRNGEAQVLFKGTVNGRPIKNTAILEFPAIDDSNPEIERMWAWQHVQNLEKTIDSTGSKSAAVDKIIQLGETYSIASEYTSFLVLENNQEYKRWKIEQRNAERMKRDRRAQNLRRTMLEKIRSRAIENLGPVDNGQQLKLTSANQVNQQAGRRQMPNNSANRPATANRTNNSRQSVNIPRSRGGGGALDPYSALFALALAGSILVSCNKKK
jgi:Ca-activated chloride channel family protein